MTVFLRKSESKLYYAGYGRWAAQTDRAKPFHSIEDALLLNRQERLQGMEVVVQHSTPGSKMVLPIGAQEWRKRQPIFF